MTAILPVGSGDTVFPYSGGSYVTAYGSTFNVKQYGAVGNGVADDTSAFTTALAALRATGGGSLYIPAGTYKITSTLTVNLTDPITGNVQSAHIYGDGAKSIINYTPVDGTDCLYVLGVVGGVPTLHIHDLRINGAGAGSGNGLVLRRCIMPAQLDSLSITGFGGGAGIKLISCWTTDIRDVWVYDGKYGYTFENDVVPGTYGSTVNISMYNCAVQGMTSHGIYGNQAPLHFEIINCIIEGNTGSGVYLDHARHVHIVNCYLELNTNYHIYAIHSPSICIRQCTGGGALSVYLDADTGGSIFEQNDWDNPPVVDGFGMRSIMNTVPIGSGQWRNLETMNSEGYFGANDTTPSVAPNAYGNKTYYTANTIPTTITNFDNGSICQDILVIVNDAFTTLDFSASYLKGNAGVDYAASSGDTIHAISYMFGGTLFWSCTITKAS